MHPKASWDASLHNQSVCVCVCECLYVQVHVYMSTYILQREFRETQNRTIHK